MKLKLNVAKMCLAFATLLVAAAPSAMGQQGTKTRTVPVSVSVIDNSVPVQSVNFSPTSVMGGSISVATVTLTQPVVAGAVKVTLQSDNLAAGVPSFVQVYQGQSSASFSVITTGVNVSTTANISATCKSVTKSAPLTILPVSISSFTLSPTPLIGGNGSSTGTITLPGAAPYPGLTITLASSDTSVTVPANVTIGQGLNSATFASTTAPVTAIKNVTITATLAGTPTTATLTIQPYTVTGLSLSPPSLSGGYGATTTGTVTLVAPAPTGGITVNLTSSNTGVATVPTTVLVPQGSTTAPFTISTSAVSSTATSTITAALNGSTSSATLTVNPYLINSVVLSPTAVYGGQGNTSTGTITLNSPAPAGLTVSLSSNNTSVATVPATVNFASGASTATFTISTALVNTSTNVTFTAGLAGNNTTASVTVNPYQISSFVASPTTVYGAPGNNSTGTITLNAPAPSNGLSISFSSNNSAAATAASPVTIAAGATSGTFTITTGLVTSNTSVTLTAGLAGVNTTANLQIDAYQVAGISLAPTTVIGTVPSIGTVTINSPAPPSGMLVNLSSSNTSAATTPSTALIPGNSTTGTFTVATNQVNTTQSATITASFGTSQQTQSLSITGCKLTGLTLTPASIPGGDLPNPASITISSPAPAGGAIVTLSSSNPAAASVPLTAIVPAGTTSTTFPVTTYGVASNTSVVITATYGVPQTVTETIQPSTLYSVSAAPATAVGGSSTVISGAIRLNGQAIPGGSVVTLTSSNPSAATVPATVTIGTGAESAAFTVTTLAVSTTQSVTITATYGTKSLTTTALTITPASLKTLSISPASIVGGDNPYPGVVSISLPAPVGGGVVSLSSSNSAVVVPTTVTIPAGTTSTTFPVTTNGVGTSTAATITASYGGTQATCTETVTPASLLSLAIAPTSIIGGPASQVTATLKLNGKAGPSGTSVGLTSSNTSVATVPSTVTVASGAETVFIPVTTLTTSTGATVTITASIGTANVTSTLTVTPGALGSVTISPASIPGGDNTNPGVITLLSPAPTGGSVVTLTTSSNSVGIPTSVTVPAGSTTTTFPVTTKGVTVSTPVTITATCGAVQTCTETLTPSVLYRAYTTTASIAGGATATGVVQLNGQAGPGGTVVSLSSLNTALATVPATVTVAAYTETITFPITTSSVTASTAVTIQATLGTQHVTTSLTVIPATLTSVTISPTSIIGGDSPHPGVVTLNGVAPTGGAVVTLSAANSALVGVPASVTIPAGSASTTFPVTTSGVASSTPVVITATYGVSQACTLTLTPASLYTLTLSTSTVQGGSATVVTAKVMLNGASAPAGAVVTLHSSNGGVASVPQTVTIAGNHFSNFFTVGTAAVGAITPVTISAVYNGVTLTAVLTVTP